MNADEALQMIVAVVLILSAIGLFALLLEHWERHHMHDESEE